jgi:predicted secreted protein
MSNTDNSEAKQKRTVHFVISDPDGSWYALAQKAIADNESDLFPDEKTPQNLVRLFLKNADVCIKAIRQNQE